MRFDFTVPGHAAPKGSSRIGINRVTGRAVVLADNFDRLKSWEHAVRVYALRVPQRQRLEGPVGLTAAFYFQRPASVSARKRPYPSVKPDLSKLLRGIEDALTGVLYVDDAQIVQAVCSKHYCEPSDTPGVRISLFPLQGGR